MALAEQLGNLIGRSELTEVGIFFQLGPNSRPVEVHPDLPFHAASTMKVPVMMEVFRQARRGRILVDDPVELENFFRSAVPGQTFSLDLAEDADPSLYDFLGKSVPVRELAERMIVRSSNLATNLLLDRIGVSAVQELIRELGCTELKVVRGVEDNAAYQAGIFNSTTARALGKLFCELAYGKAFQSGDREEMLGILSRQEHLDGIPAGVKGARRICNKTGWVSDFYHDAAYVELEKSSFVLVVLTRSGAHEISNRFIAEAATLFTEAARH